jgi:ParB-like chromosome segregation protein Spo0J
MGGDVKRHPLQDLKWVAPSVLHANGYNPNHVFGPEMDLLRLSILEDGWTQPIVARAGGEIVDGFHRWTLAQRHPELQVNGNVPVVYLPDEKSLPDQMLSTIRHNRARGQHGILKMGEIVRTLRDAGLTEEEVERRLGMEAEERERLEDLRTSPAAAGKESFGRGWVPTRSAG